MLRYLTAGESHGQMLVGILEGMPAGVPLRAGDIDPHLSRRQGGYGRGGRQKIEKDRARIVAGIRNGHTMGSPVAILVDNRDWKNWQGVMNVDPRDIDVDRSAKRAVLAPRPGHADLAGGLKYDRRDLRDVLERASARETAIRVAIGSVARKLLEELGVRVVGHVVAIGPEEVAEERLNELTVAEIAARAAESPVYCADEDASQAMVAAIREAMTRNDTLGGDVEVRVTGLPVGLGSHVDPGRRLDARLSGALMGIQAVKGVSVGYGFSGSRMYGSEVHDPIRYDPRPDTARAGGYFRTRNGAGGLEGGITNGADLVLRIAMKPLSTLTHPLPSVDIATKGATGAAVERTDVTAVPALSVVAEAAVALVLSDAVLEKFGGDSLEEIRRNLAGYIDQIGRHPGGTAGSEAAGLDTAADRAPMADEVRLGDRVATPPAAARHPRVKSAERRASGPNLVLIGLPGTGKSSVASAVARVAGVPVIDTDAVVVRKARRPIEVIFAESGEEAFRKIEDAAVQSVAPFAATVVATGGGVPCLPSNRDWLRSGGLVVWLRGSLSDLEQRLLASDIPRPLLGTIAESAPRAGGEMMRALARLEAERRDLYAAMADVVVDIDGKDVASIASEVDALWRDAARQAPRLAAEWSAGLPSIAASNG